MSVASVAQYLQDQGGGSDTNVFPELYIGLDGDPQVVLNCDVDGELLVAGETVATVPFADANYISNSDYLTTVDFESYLNTNYTNTTDLEAGYVQNATLADYSTTTDFQTYLTTNYSTTTDFQTYLTTNYTDTTALEAGYVQNATIANYYTKTESNASFQPIGNYMLSSNFGKFNGNVTIVVALAQNEVYPVQNVIIPNFVDTDGSASYICGISVALFNGTPLNTSAVWVSTDGTNTNITVTFTNMAIATTTANLVLLLSVIAMK